MFNIILIAVILFFMFFYIFFFFNSEKLINDDKYFKKISIFTLILTIVFGFFVCNMPEYSEYKTQKEIQNLKNK